MLALSLPPAGRTPLRLLCLGAHADDIEIGCGGSLLRLLAERAATVDWIVFSATPARAREDRHQDHRLISDLTWNTWRNHLVLEYEIPKYDGDLGHPNVFVALTPETLAKKVALISHCFPSQRDRTWFSPDVFEGLARLRGVESGACTPSAEAFTARKVLV